MIQTAILTVNDFSREATGKSRVVARANARRRWARKSLGADGSRDDSHPQLHASDHGGEYLVPIDRDARNRSELGLSFQLENSWGSVTSSF